MENINDQTYNIGYGLIGAYLLVFIGIAVSSMYILTLERRTNIAVLGIDRPVPTLDISGNHHG